MIRSAAYALLCLAEIAGGASRTRADDDAIRRVHDPVIICENGAYYIFSSGRGVPVRRSRDLVHWEMAGRVFAEDLPEWGRREVPGSRDVWAPDISHFNGRFHLYYSISTLGSQRSCIGVATNRTLDPSSPDFRWIDHGKVIETFPGRMDYNAIDPNLALDEQGRPWLVFGSFWGGIQIVRIDPQTGKLAPGDDRVRPIAARPQEKAIEGAFLVRRNGWYWLFASFDQCCRGVASNYKVRVGRSREITGPYVDFRGRPMLEGGGTLVLAGYGTWRGPGHNGILLGDDGDWMVHHMYDAAAGGIPTLQVRPLLWGADGWPLAGEPVTAASATRPAPPPRDVAGIWRHSVNVGADEYIELRPDGTANSPVTGATWRLEGATLRMRWPDPSAPSGAWIDTCVVAPDAKSFVGRNQKGDLIRALRASPD